MISHRTHIFFIALPAFLFLNSSAMGESSTSGVYGWGKANCAVLGTDWGERSTVDLTSDVEDSLQQWALGYFAGRNKQESPEDHKGIAKAEANLLAYRIRKMCIERIRSNGQTNHYISEVVEEIYGDLPKASEVEDSAMS